MYSYFHLSALQKANCLANEAFALHFLQDTFAAGHVSGTWGSTSQRKGTHDFYNANGLEVLTWDHRGGTLVIMGDAHLRPDDAKVAAMAVRASLDQLVDAAAGKPVPGVRHSTTVASHDVPAVNSHYKKWRKPMIEAGVSLYEIRHDAAVQRELADTAPVRSEFMGLHVKAVAVDGERVMIGSMNLDPRSAAINSEMAVIVESQGLAADVVALIRRDMQPVNSWRVELDAQGALRWVNSEKTVTQQPARNAWQRVEDIIFMAFPRDYY